MKKTKTTGVWRRRQRIVSTLIRNPIATPTHQSLFFFKLKQNAGHDLKDSALAFNGAAAAAAAAAGWPYPSMYYPYDPSLAAYPFGG